MREKDEPGARDRCRREGVPNFLIEQRNLFYLGKIAQERLANKRVTVVDDKPAAEEPPAAPATKWRPSYMDDEPVAANDDVWPPVDDTPKASEDDAWPPVDDVPAEVEPEPAREPTPEPVVEEVKEVILKNQPGGLAN